MADNWEWTLLERVSSMVHLPGTHYRTYVCEHGSDWKVWPRCAGRARNTHLWCLRV